MRFSKRFAKLLVIILTFSVLITAVPQDYVSADNRQPPPQPGGAPTGDQDWSGGGGGSGNNFWYLCPHDGDPSTLRLDVYVAHTESGGRVASNRNASNGWPYPCAYSLGASKSSFRGSGLNIVNSFNWGTNQGYLTIISKDFGVAGQCDWQQYADALNDWVEANYPGTTSNYTAAQLVTAVDNYLSGSYNPGWGGEGYNPSRNRAVNGWINYPGSSNRLAYIDLKGFAGLDIPEPEPIPTVEPNCDSETESKWLLCYLNGPTYGSMYNPDSNLLDGYNLIQNFSYYNDERNSFSNLEAIWNGVPDLSYSRTINYSVASETDANATYILVTRRRTREAIYVPIYQDPPHEDIIDRWEFRGWTDWSPWSYYIAGTRTVTNTGSILNDTYEPDYALYNWMDLTSETWTNNTSRLVTSPSALPSDYREVTNFTNTNLNFVLNSGKTPGEVFTVISDNNPKTIGLNFSGIFGSSVPTTRPTNLGGVWLISSQLNFGPVQNPASNPVVSVQRVSPNPGADEETGYTYYSWPGTSSVNFQAKIRSILYGDYTLGDGRGSNYWYTYIRIAALNRLGSSYSVSAPGVLSVEPTSSVISISSSSLSNEIGLTHTFIQPVLVGEIDTRDAAGT